MNALLLTDVTYVIITPSATSNPLSTCISYFIPCLFGICYSMSLISLLVLFACGLMNTCPLRGHLVLRSISGSAASCKVGRQCFFRRCLQIYGSGARTTAIGGLWRNPLKHKFHQEANDETSSTSSASWLCSS